MQGRFNSIFLDRFVNNTSIKQRENQRSGMEVMFVGRSFFPAKALSLCLMLAVFTAGAPAYAWRLEAGRVTTNDTFATATFTTVTFQTVFDVTPIVVALASDEGGDPSALRIRNVTTTGFEIAAVEPTGNDGPHVAMTVDYVAMEPGVHQLPTGETVVAGFHTTASVQRSGVVGGAAAWDTVNFGATLSATASVVASIQTMNSESGAPPGGPSQPWLTMAIRNPSTTNVQMALERSEAAAGAVVAETIGYIAFPNGSNSTFIDDGNTSTEWSAVTTADLIVGWDNGCTNHTFSTTAFATARVVATKNRRDGADGGWLRRCALTATQIGLVVDEDIANDPERAHTNEAAGVIAFSRSFHALFEGVLNAKKDVVVAEDPVNGTVGAYAIPGARMRYTVQVESLGRLPIDNDSITFIDILPPETRFVVSDIAGAGSGPVRFTDGSTSSALTYTFSSLGSMTDDIEFSDNGGASFMYTPIPGPNGADDNVTHFRIRPKGSFAGDTSTASPSFELEYDVLIDE